MLEVFDGELQIMARLEKSISDVHLVRSEAERDTVWRAMLLQGFAVQRYFQDRLATDPTAAAYRTGSGAGVGVAAWMDAAAIVGAPVPTAADLPDPTAVTSYDSVQATTRSMPSLTFVVGELSKGAEAYVDGRKVPAGGRVLATPGRHFAHIEAGGVVLWAKSERFSAGATVTMSAPFGPAERDELASLATNAGSGWTVPPVSLAVIRSVGEPVYVAVPAEGRPTLLRLDGGTATETRIKRDDSETGGFLVRAAVGAGWASSGDWFLQNADAPYTTGTVNALTPAGSVGAGFRSGWFYVGGGADIIVPVGAFHFLPSGDGNVRPWTYLHADIGIPYAQLTIGPEFPWYLGVGVQGTVPVVGPLEVFAKGVYGAPIAIKREGAEPFEPLGTWSAWGGVAIRIGG